jgi:hypothetical protein
LLGCRVGLAPTGKRRLFTAHATFGLMPCSNSELLDNLVGAYQDSWRNIYINSLGGLEV